MSTSNSNPILGTAETPRGDGDHVAVVTPPMKRRRRTLALAAVAAIAVVAAAAIVVPMQLQAAHDRDVWDAYSRELAEHDVAVDAYLEGGGALVNRYDLAGEEMDTFLNLIRLTPDDVLDPVEAKHAFVQAVEQFRVTAGVTSSEADETVPAAYEAQLGGLHAERLSASTAIERVESQTFQLARAGADYAEANALNADILAVVDSAYEEVLVRLDAMMQAGQAWGARDVYEKDTPEQSDALIAAAQALVKPEGEHFVTLADRVTAVDAFVGAQSAALAGHNQTIAAEEEAARQAASAEAERQAAAQRQQRQQSNNSSGSRNGTGNKNNSSSSSPPSNGGGAPGGGMGAPRNDGDCGCLGNKNVWE